MMKLPTEEQEQISLIQWASLYPHIISYLFHIPNGKLRDKITGYRLKKMGVKAGVFDLFLAIPMGRFHGLFIEMKRAKGYSVSKEQCAFGKLMNSIGYHATYAYGFLSAKKIIEDYLNDDIREEINA